MEIKDIQTYSKVLELTLAVSFVICGILIGYAVFSGFDIVFIIGFVLVVVVVEVAMIYSAYKRTLTKISSYCESTYKAQDLVIDCGVSQQNTRAILRNILLVFWSCTAMGIYWMYTLIVAPEGFSVINIMISLIWVVAVGYSAAGLDHAVNWASEEIILQNNYRLEALFE